MFEIELQLFGGRGGPSKGGGGGSVVVEGIQELQPTSKTTITKVGKAAFEKTYTEARGWVRDRHITEEDQLTVRVDFGENSHASLNTLRGIQALIKSERKNIERSVELGVTDKKKAEAKRVALNAVQRGLNLTYEIYKEVGWIK